MGSCNIINLRNLLIVLAINMWVKSEIVGFKSVHTTVKAPENDTVLLPCYLDTISSTDTEYSENVKWYHNDKLLESESDGQSSRYTVWKNGSLEIKSIEPQDTGEYMCEIIRREPWSPVRQSHAIEVLESPSVEPDPLSGYLQVKLGDDVRISCKAKGVPYPLMSWKHEGRDLNLLDNRELLKFAASELDQAGDYECIAMNGVGEPATAKIHVNILYPPVPRTSHFWIHTAVGHMAQLDCAVSSNPPALVTWFKSSKPVSFGKRVFTTTDDQKHTLFIKNVQTSDFGMYSCVAKNQLGEGKLDITLSGNPNPAAFKKFDQKNENTRTSYTLIWQVTSYMPLIEYKLLFRPYRARSKPEWTKLTIPAQRSTGFLFSSSYTITGLKEKTIYEAVVLSRNKHGWSDPSSVIRFATEGAELKEETITSVYIHTQEINTLPLDLVYNRGNTPINLSVILTISMFLRMILQ